MRLRCALPFAILCAMSPVPVANATPADCWTSFANLSEFGPAANKIVRDTYRDLWTVLGLKHLTMEELQRLADENDPFLEQADIPSGLHGLRHHLADYKKLLALKHWNSEATRAAFQEELNTLAALARTAQATQTAALDQAKVFSLGAGWGSAAFSGGGDWLVAYRDGGRHLWLTNVPTGQSTKMTASYDFPYGVRPAVTRDGRFVLATRDNPLYEELRCFPIENGAVEEAKSFTLPLPRPNYFGRKVLKKTAPTRLSKILATPAPNLVLVTTSLSAVPYVFDIEKRTSTPLRMRNPLLRIGPFFRDRVLDTGIIPGTGELYSLTRNEKGTLLLQKGTFDKSRLSQVQAVGKWAGFPNSKQHRAKLNWAGDGQSATAILDSTLFHVDAKKGTEELSTPKDRQTAYPEYPRFAAPTIDGKKIAVVLGHNGSRFGRMVWYDVENRRWSPDVRKIPIFTHEPILLSPDGQTLYFKGDAPGETKYIPLELN